MNYDNSSKSDIEAIKQRMSRLQQQYSNHSPETQAIPPHQPYPPPDYVANLQYVPIPNQLAAYQRTPEGHTAEGHLNTQHVVHHVDPMNVLIYERNSLSRSLEIANQQMQNLKKENEVLALKNEESMNKIAKYEHQIKSEEEKIREITEKFDQVNERLSVQRRDTEKNLLDICNLKAENAELKTLLDNKVNECLRFKEITKKIDQLELHNTSAKDSLHTEMLIQIETLKKKLNTKQDDLLHLNQLYSTLREKYNKMEETNKITYQEHLKAIQMAQNKIFQLEEHELRLQNEIVSVKELLYSHKANDTNTKNNGLLAIIDQKDLIIKELNKKLENLEILDQDRRVLLEKVRSDRGIVEKCVTQNAQLKTMFDEHVEKIKELTEQKHDLKLYYENLLSKQVEKRSVDIDQAGILSLLLDASKDLYELSVKMSLYNKLDTYSSYDILTKSYENLSKSIANINLKNENLKHVNDRLSRTLDSDCEVIKQLNMTIYQLKDQISRYVELNPDVKLNKEIFEDGKNSLADIFEEKFLLHKQITALTSELESLKTIQVKSEDCATLERHLTRLKYEKCLVEQKIEELNQKNSLLAEECNTISDYVQLYVSQRLAMGTMIENIANYFEIMNIKLVKVYNDIFTLIEFIEGKILVGSGIDPSTFKKLYLNFSKNFDLFLYHVTYDESVNILNNYKTKKSTIIYPWVDKIKGYKDEHS